VTTLTGDGCGYFRVEAMTGGTVNLSNLVSIARHGVALLADGPGAVLDVSRLNSFISQGSPLASLTARNNGVILLGTSALLLANVTVDIPPGNPVLPPAFISDPNLTLHGSAWRSYLVEQRSTLNPTNDWQFLQRVPLTNSFQQIAGPPRANTDYRVAEFVVNPSRVDLNRPPGQQVQRVLYGAPTNTFEVQTKTNLDAIVRWQPLTSVTLTNPFRIFAPMSTTNAAPFYRARKLWAAGRASTSAQNLSQCRRQPFVLHQRVVKLRGDAEPSLREGGPVDDGDFDLKLGQQSRLERGLVNRRWRQFVCGGRGQR